MSIIQKKLKKEFFDTLNSNKVNRNILTDGDVEIIENDGCYLLVINVPQVDYRQRPIYINGNMMNGSFKRYARPSKQRSLDFLFVEF